MSGFYEGFESSGSEAVLQLGVYTLQLETMWEMQDYGKLVHGKEMGFKNLRAYIPMAHSLMRLIMSLDHVRYLPECFISIALIWRIGLTWIRRIKLVSFVVFCEVHAQIRCIFLDGYGVLGVRTDSEDGPAHPNIIYEEPDDKASSSDKDVFDEGQKRDAFYQSKADTAPHAPTVHLLRNRKEGPGARASWVFIIRLRVDHSTIFHQKYHTNKAAEAHIHGRNDGIDMCVRSHPHSSLTKG
nr:hypothetical protein [Tanacetum cinerariifolium]